MKVAVGSKNPVKIQATKEAFEKVFPEMKWEVIGIEVESEVSNQPMSDTESIKGARNRARKAMKKLKADYGVGLEGGLHHIGKYWFDNGWIVVVDKQGNEGIGSTVKMPTPQVLMELVHQGIELGIANDMVFKTVNSKHAEGHFGLMTKNAITRTSGYRDGVISALSRFVHPDLFVEKPLAKKKMTMKRNNKIITICSSAAHYKHVLDIEKQLETMGFRVKIPKTANVMKRTNNFDVSTYKTWYTNKNDYKKKTQLMNGHFKKVMEADAILVTNFEKNGLQGYIGGNVLMEMVLAFHYKKPIFIYNSISEDLGIKEEVYGLNPIFLDGDLSILTKKLH